MDIKFVIDFPHPRQPNIYQLFDEINVIVPSKADILSNTKKLRMLSVKKTRHFKTRSFASILTYPTALSTLDDGNRLTDWLVSLSVAPAAKW